jgi:hypothetical protein
MIEEVSIYQLGVFLSHVQNLLQVIHIVDGHHGRTHGVRSEIKLLMT